MAEFYVMMRPADAPDEASGAWQVVAGGWHVAGPAKVVKDVLDKVNKPRRVEVVKVLTAEELEQAQDSAAEFAARLYPVVRPARRRR